MGKTKTAATTGATPTDAATAAPAHNDHTAIVEHLLGGDTDPGCIAQIIDDHPRYETDIFEYVSSKLANAVMNQVFAELDTIYALTDGRPLSSAGRAGQPPVPDALRRTLTRQRGPHCGVAFYARKMPL